MFKFLVFTGDYFYDYFYDHFELPFCMKCAI